MLPLPCRASAEAAILDFYSLLYRAATELAIDLFSPLSAEPLPSPSATDLPARYRSQLKPLQYREGALLDPASGFYFRNQATQKAPGGDLMRKWLKRVTR